MPSYYDRAMKNKDPRYERLLLKLGYGPSSSKKPNAAPAIIQERIIAVQGLEEPEVVEAVPVVGEAVVEEVVTPVVELEAPSVTEGEPVRQKRSYKRRDMKAED